MRKVSVITLNKTRTEELLRCAQSIVRQDYRGEIEHVIIGDQSDTLPTLEKRLLEINPHVRIFNWTKPFPPEVNPIFRISKFGFLRNWGTEVSTGDYIAQIGDDDTFEPNHISSLAETLESAPDIGVAYSWRTLVDANGRPAPDVKYPWAPNARHITSREDLGAFIYESLIRQGVRERNSAVVRDTVIAPDGEEVFTVDTNCMLAKRWVLEKIPWHVRYTWREICQDYSDDHRFIESVYRAGIRIACSKKITVNYTIGGTSNTPSNG